MNTNYPYIVYLDENDGEKLWVCEFIDLAGCIGVGETENEAITEARENLQIWLETAQENDKRIPAASSWMTEDYSGSFVLRIPKSLHKSLALRAKKENVSMNTLCVSILAGEHNNETHQHVINLNYIAASTTTSEEGKWQTLRTKKNQGKRHEKISVAELYS